MHRIWLKLPAIMKRRKPKRFLNFLALRQRGNDGASMSFGGSPETGQAGQ